VAKIAKIAVATMLDRTLLMESRPNMTKQ